MPTDFATSPARAVQTPRGFDGGFVRARVEQRRHRSAGKGRHCRAAKENQRSNPCQFDHKWTYHKAQQPSEVERVGYGGDDAVMYECHR